MCCCWLGKNLAHPERVVEPDGVVAVVAEVDVRDDVVGLRQAHQVRVGPVGRRQDGAHAGVRRLDQGEALVDGTGEGGGWSYPTRFLLLQFSVYNSQYLFTKGWRTKLLLLFLSPTLIMYYGESGGVLLPNQYRQREFVAPPLAFLTPYE